MAHIFVGKDDIVLRRDVIRNVVVKDQTEKPEYDKTGIVSPMRSMISRTIKTYTSTNQLRKYPKAKRAAPIQHG